MKRLEQKVQDGRAHWQAPDEISALLAGSQEILRLYKLKDGRLFSLGGPLPREDAKLAAYFVVERYAQFLDMSVPEFIMNMMRHYHNEKSDGA